MDVDFYRNIQLEIGSDLTGQMACVTLVDLKAMEPLNERALFSFKKFALLEFEIGGVSANSDVLLLVEVRQPHPNGFNVPSYFGGVMISELAPESTCRLDLFAFTRIARMADLTELVACLTGGKTSRTKKLPLALSVKWRADTSEEAGTPISQRRLSRQLPVPSVLLAKEPRHNLHVRPRMVRWPFTLGVHNIICALQARKDDAAIDIPSGLEWFEIAADGKRVSEVQTSVIPGERCPKFNDQFKLCLPFLPDAKIHLVVSFYQISVHSTDKVGWRLLRILLRHV